jgi:hypothetical protein
VLYGAEVAGLTELQIRRRSQSDDGEEVAPMLKGKCEPHPGRMRVGRVGAARGGDAVEVEMEMDVKPSHPFHFGATVCVIWLSDRRESG